MINIQNNKYLIATLLLLAICLSAYGNALNSDFLLDDTRYLIGEKNVSTISFQNLLTQSYHGHYRPVARAFLKLVILISGQTPSSYHLIQLLLFLGICLLLFTLILKLFKNFELALLTSCLFAAHPIHHMLINYKMSVGFCLNLIIILTSVLLLLKYIKEGKLRFLLLSLTLYLASLLCHEISFMLPVYLFLILYFKKDLSLKQNVLLCFWYTIPLLLYILIRASIVGLSPRESFDGGGILSIDISFYQYITTMMRLVGWYMSKLFMPRNILMIWDEPIAENVFSLGPFLGLTVMLAAFIIAFLKKQKNSAAFGLCLFLSGFLPLLLAALVYTARTGTAIIEPYWFTFPSMGFFVILASLLLCIKNKLNPTISSIVAVVLISGLCLFTRTANTAWKDPLTYCTYWMEQNQHNTTAFSCHAKEHLKEIDKGLDPSRYQDCTEVSFVAGTYNFIGERETALKYYNLALEMSTSCKFAYLGLGVLHLDISEYALAEKNLRKAIYVDPQFTMAYERLLEVYKKQGKTLEAKRVRALLNR